MPNLIYTAGSDSVSYRPYIMADKTLSNIKSHNVPIFSVGELSSAIKNTVEGAFHHVRVRGELSGFKRAASGHMYFALKDEDAVLDGICWKGTAARLGLKPEDGMDVVVTGRLTTYGARSTYQIIIETMELAGEGALLKLLEERKRRLGEEGLFDADRKQDLPWLPDVIGVVTSPTGAVIRDIIHRIEDRFPRHVLLWPVLVQGDTAAEQITAAIEGFNALDENSPLPRPDVLIVARGGGSLEDLWAFNEENVVRAAANSDIPLISAVGHETDTTLLDYVSDQRAPTPTAAAEMAVPVRMDLAAQVTDNSRRMTSSMSRSLDERRRHLEALSRGLPSLQRLSDEATQRLDDWSERLDNSLRVGLERRKDRFSGLAARLRRPTALIDNASDHLASQSRALNSAIRVKLKDHAAQLENKTALLESYSYKRTLERGFALVSDKDGGALRNASDISGGMAFNVEFHDGPVAAIAGGTPVKPVRKKAVKPKSSKDDSQEDPQGSLL